MKTFELRDLKLALALAGLYPVAWLLPERFWPGFCRIVTAYKRVAPWERLPDAAVVKAVLTPEVGAERPRIATGGLEHLDAALERGRGAILWMTHFIHNGLVGKMALHAHGYRVLHLSRPEHGFSKTRVGIRTINRVRVRAEDPFLAERIVIDRDHSLGYMQRLLEALSRNGIVSITAGAWEGRRVVEAGILGRRVALANGAPAIAHRTGAALLPVVGCRLPGNEGFRVEILPPLPIDSRAGRDTEASRATGEFLERTEPWVREFPAQWRSWNKLY